MPKAGETRGTSRERGGQPLSQVVRDPPKAYAFPFASQLEAWRENARGRSNGKLGSSARDNPKPLLRGGRLSDGTEGSQGKYKGRHRDISECSGSSDSDSDDNDGIVTEARKRSEAYVTNPPKKDRNVKEVWTGRAWNSGSLLVRPGGDAPTGRVTRTTYIYLVGTVGREDGVEVEVLVGADEARTVMSRATGVMSVCVPSKQVFTVRNLAKGGKTVVLYWTSPSREVGKLHSHAQKRRLEAQGRNAKEEAKQKISQELGRQSRALKNRVTPASTTPECVFPEGMYGME